MGLLSWTFGPDIYMFDPHLDGISEYFFENVDLERTK